jgi:hypothetical protein
MAVVESHMTSKEAAQCGVEEKIYDETGVWADSVTCHLNEGHDGQHQAVFSWDTEAQLEAQLDRVLAQKEKLRPTEKGGGSE